APGPRNTSIGPGGDHNVCVAVKADSAVPTAKRWGSVRSVQQSVRIGLHWSTIRGVSQPLASRQHVHAVDALAIIVQHVLAMSVFVDRSAGPVNEQAVADGLLRHRPLSPEAPFRA